MRANYAIGDLESLPLKLVHRMRNKERLRYCEREGEMEAMLKPVSQRKRVTNRQIYYHRECHKDRERETDTEGEWTKKLEPVGQAEIERQTEH